MQVPTTQNSGRRVTIRSAISPVEQHVLEFEVWTYHRMLETTLSCFTFSTQARLVTGFRVRWNGSSLPPRHTRVVGVLEP